MLHRQGYLPTLSSTIREHFLPYTAEREDELWYSVDDVPLDWRLPHGVLYDMHHTIWTTPLHITVHFQRFPSHLLTRCRTAGTLRSHVLNSLKQCLHLRYGSSKLATALSGAETQALWDAIHDTDERTYATMINRARNAHGDDNQQYGTWKSLCVRLLFSGFQAEQAAPSGFLQRPIHDVDDSGQRQTTVRDFLLQWTPFIFYTNDKGESELYDDLSAIVQGVVVPLDTPLKWLCQHMASADMFTYILVRRENNAMKTR